MVWLLFRASGVYFGKGFEGHFLRVYRDGTEFGGCDATIKEPRVQGLCVRRNGRNVDREPMNGVPKLCRKRGMVD